MNSVDTFLLIGTLLAVISILGAFGAVADGRSPRSGLVIGLFAFGAFWYANELSGRNLTSSSVPDAVIKFVAALIN